MTTRINRRYDRDFKLAAVGRMEAGENVAALSLELGVKRKLLYDWWRAFRLSGAEVTQPMPDIHICYINLHIDHLIVGVNNHSQMHPRQQDGLDMKYRQERKTSHATCP